MTELELVPTAMVAGGRALARDGGGRVVFVDGALPGERVRARLIDERRDFARAVAVEVVDPSPDRVAPPCPALAAGCGGCTWQHVAPGAQARLKASIVVDALRRIGRLPDPPVPGVARVPGPALRTTARLAVSAEGRAGHRPRADGTGPGLPVPTDACMVAHPLLDELLVSGRYPGAAEVLLRVGVASGERVVRAKYRPRDVEVPAGVVVVGERDRRPASVHEEVAGRRFRISVWSFFQPGPVVAEGLVAAVRAAVDGALPEGGHLVDAYAGVGLFGSVLGASHRVMVTALESAPAAVADARANLADVDARVVAGEVGRWRPAPADPPVDVVVADPSRTGLGRPGVGTIGAARPGRVVLVSCDPASLGRDAALLADAGYRLTSVDLVDAFPHTFHVETVSRFDAA